jgi:hypothetical protein
MKDENRMPIGFAMALSHDPVAMGRFLRMENEKQDYILECARRADGFVAMQELVAGMLGTSDSEFSENPCNRRKNVIE